MKRSDVNFTQGSDTLHYYSNNYPRTSKSNVIKVSLKL